MSQPKTNRKDLLGFPRSYAFVIGINYYPLINADLISAVPDAKEIARMLKEEQGFDHVEVLLGVAPETQAQMAGELKVSEGMLVSLDANGKSIRELFNRLKDPERDPKIQPEDSIVFYYAGHGKAGEFKDGPVGFLFPSDARPKKVHSNNDSLIRMEELYETLELLNCHHTLLVLDCCFAGKFRYVGTQNRDVSEPFFLPMYEERFERFKREKAWQVLVSAGPHQTAVDWLCERSDTENKGKVHSPFALAFFEALSGKADIKPPEKNFGDGVITVQELYLYLFDRLENIIKGNSEEISQVPDLFPMGNHQGGQFIFFDPTNKLNFVSFDEQNPYKGLNAFDLKDAELFFGRRKSIFELLSKLKNTSILIISSPSGYGKTSLVKAGLFSALVQSSTRWKQENFFIMRPGAHPLQAFAQIEDQLDVNVYQLILIDQYEELFTDCHNIEEKEVFESKLVELLAKIEKGKKQKLIITIRSDFEWLLQMSYLGENIWNKRMLTTFLYHLPPMGLDELREALVQPAFREMFEFEPPQLIDDILSEIAYAPGALPLLSFTMSRLYEKSSKGVNFPRFFTKDAYQTIGGVQGALSSYATEIYGNLDKIISVRNGSIIHYQSMLRKLILRMVKLSDGTYIRRKVYTKSIKDLNELDYVTHQKEIVEQLLEILEAKHLIVIGQDDQGTYCEPIHDALIQHWAKSKAWMRDFGDNNLSLQRQLWQAIQEKNSSLWNSNPKLLQIIEQVIMDEKKFLNVDNHEGIQNLKNKLSGADLISFETLLDQWKNHDAIPYLDDFIITGVTSDFLKIVLEQGNHWLNSAESLFILESWEKRNRDIIALKKERDEARAVALAATARQIYTEYGEHTMALNLAYKAIKIKAIPQTIAALSFICTNENSSFYEKSFVGHENSLAAVAFSPNGQYILTGSGDKTAKLWDTQSGKEIRTFVGHTEYVSAIEFSSDGNYILTGSWDQSVKLWEVKSGREVRAFDGFNSTIEDISISPNGEYFITIDEYQTVKLWEIKSGKEIKTFNGHDAQVCAMTFSPDGKFILTGSWDTSAKLWDVSSGQIIKSFEGHKQEVVAVAFSPDGHSILTGSWDKTAKLWDVNSGIELKTYTGHLAKVEAVAFSPNGKYVLTSGWDHTAKMWNAKSGEEVGTFSGHISEVVSVAFSPSGNYALTGSWDQSAKLWKILPNQIVRSFVGHDNSIEAVDFSPNGKYVFTGGEDNSVKQWETDTGLEVRSFLGHEGTIISLAISPNGKYLLTTGLDAHVKLWDIDTGEELRTFNENNTIMSSVAFSPNGNQILLGGWDHKARLLELQTGNEIRIFEGHKQEISEVAFTPNGINILTASNDNTAKLWDIMSGEEIITFEGHHTGIETLAISADGCYVLTGSWDSEVKLWEIKSGQEIRTFTGHIDIVVSVAFSPDGSLALTGSRGEGAKLWDVATGVCLCNFSAEYSSGLAVAFSSNGKYLLISDVEFSATLWKNENPVSQLEEGRIQKLTLEQIRSYEMEIELYENIK